MPETLSWEFLLNGDTQEFRELARNQGTSYFRIYGGIDHWLDCPNDDFRMTTAFCEGETDASIVWQIGYELISLFNGASVLFSRKYRKAEIFRVLNHEQQTSYVGKVFNPGLLGRPAMSKQQVEDEFRKGLESSIKLGLLHLATENQDVYFILKYLDMSADWSTYYKLMEAIEVFAKDNGIDLETKTSDRKAFTNTANNFSLSGFDSRHGFKQVAKSNNTASMTIDEGYSFVTSMAKTYLQKRYFSK